jgi:NADPH2:quinone reductase
MKQIINYASPEVNLKITSGAIPEPSAKQVLIKVIVSGSNPKDWKAPLFSVSYDGPADGSFMANSKAGINQGDDIAGIVEKVGEDVIEFKVRRLRCISESRDSNLETERRPRRSFP